MKILVIGDPIIDKFTFGKVDRMSPEDPRTPVLDTHREETRLGGALNVACNLKSLNKKNAIFVSSPMSAWTIGELIFRSIGNSVQHIFSDFWGPSPFEFIKLRVINTTTNKQMIRVDNRLKFESKDIDKYKKEFERIDVSVFDAIVVSDYDKGSIDWFVIDKLRKFVGPIFVDTKKKDLSMWKDFDNIVVKVNWDEFRRAEHTNQIKNFIVTHGAKPVHLRKHGQLVRQFSVESVENADVTGAGDVFLAALVVEFLKSKKLEGAIEFAVKASGRSVTKQGTCAVDEEEIK